MQTPTDTIPLKKSHEELRPKLRRFERQRCKERPAVGVVPAGETEALAAVVRDICREGIGVLLVRRFEPGLVLDVQFQWGRRGPSWTISAQVKHAASQADGSWLLGLHMSRAFSDDEMAALLLHFDGAADSDPA
jgi:hypothetical protein